MQHQPPWMAEAWAELGQHEIPGGADNARILAMFRDAGAAGFAHDETAWCAAFVGACLKRGGVAGSGSLMARSYLGWGLSAAVGGASAPPGAIVVLKRGGDPTLGHVGFLVGETAASVLLLGGNQSDGVSVAAFARGDVLAMRWSDAAPSSASPQQPSTTTPAHSEDLFDAALAHVLEMEGGWTDDPADPGGPTNLGLTLDDLAAWHGMVLDASSRFALIDDLRRLDAAAVRPIYRQRYWLPSRADALPAALALMHFDCAVNQGLGRAARFLQQAVGADVDGDIGPLTLAAAAAADGAAALDRYAQARRAHYRSLATFARFGRGWLARVDRTLARSQALSAAAPAGPPRAPVTVSNHEGASVMTTSDTAPRAPAAPALPPNTPADAGAKWWGQSMTVWGALITAAATVLPALGPVIGVDLSAETIRQLGGQLGEVTRALAGLVGTVMTLYGRARAAQPLVRRDFQLRL